MTYYIAEGSNQRGPFRVEELAAQDVRPDTLVWCEGMAEWQRADWVPELAAAGVLRGSRPPANTARAYDAGPSSRGANAPHADRPPEGYPPPAGGYAQPYQPASYAQPGPPPMSGPLPYSPFGNAPQYQQPYQPGASNRIACGLCAILLGGLGIHKFILGMTGPGLIMLLVSVVGGIVTCGLASMAMGVIGVVEGIVYLTKTDEQFYYEYQVQKKEWF